MRRARKCLLSFFAHRIHSVRGTWNEANRLFSGTAFYIIAGGVSRVAAAAFFLYIFRIHTQRVEERRAYKSMENIILNGKIQPTFLH